MKIIKMNNDDKFDIDLSSIEAKIDDTDLFTPAEKPTVDAVNKFISTKHEFKNQPSTLNTNNFFVEYKMLVKGKEHYSGIHTSQALLQTYSVGEMLFSFPTEFIKFIYLNKARLNIMDAKKNDTDYIATGMLIPIELIIDLYGKYRTNKALKKR